MTMKTMYFTTFAEAALHLDVPDDITDPSEIADYFWDNAEFPTLSANASGWGRNWSLDLGDQWEPVEENGEPLVVDG